MDRRPERENKVRFQLHAMGTELERTLDDILDVIGELHKVPSRPHDREEIDKRIDPSRQTLEDKVRSVEQGCIGPEHPRTSIQPCAGPRIRASPHLSAAGCSQQLPAVIRTARLADRKGESKQFLVLPS
jgi:Thiamine-binding protein